MAGGHPGDATVLFREHIGRARLSIDCCEDTEGISAWQIRIKNFAAVVREGSSAGQSLYDEKNIVIGIAFTDDDRLWREIAFRPVLSECRITVRTTRMQGAAFWKIEFLLVRHYGQRSFSVITCVADFQPGTPQVNVMLQQSGMCRKALARMWVKFGELWDSPLKSRLTWR